eukprot:Hpha_TRINITY_DN17018_c5_g1::TRINITY_DN17018_c5_g1_i3::g.166087::m.166087/K08582/CAPN15; calpain-15
MPSPPEGATQLQEAKEGKEGKEVYELIQSNDDGTTTMSYYNFTRDQQLTVKLTLKNVEGKLKFSNGAKDVGGKIECKFYPGVCGEMVTGTWNGCRKGTLIDTPDKEWKAQQAAKSKAATDKAIADVKGALKKEGLKKVTAEDIARTCEKHGIHFVDLTFPPSKPSLFRDHEKGMSEVGWNRPTDYLAEGSNSALFVGEVEPADIDQGSLGDCYLLSAISCLSEFPPLVYQIFTPGQDMDLGICRVLINKHGWWHVVTMDDFFPSEGGGPIYAKNREEPNELWVSLIEKSYAKVHGSYASIRAGSGGMALADLTGAPYELFKEEDMKEKDFYKKLLDNDKHEYIQMLGTPGDDVSDYAGGGGAGAKDLAEKYSKMGLATGHAYSLIAVKEVEGHQLCMIRNPWGNDKEWTGDWSDDSKCWTPSIKKAVGWYKADDGTFWMCWSDVKKWFTSGAVCYAAAAWDQVRAVASIVNGVADLMIKIEVQSESAAWVGIHQRDPRGIKKDQDYAKHFGVQINLLQETKDGKVKIIHSPPYKPSRDICKEYKFEEPGVYYLLAQTLDEKLNRSFVYSVHSENSGFAKISFLTAKPSYKKKYHPVEKQFDKGDWEPTEAIYQVKGLFSTNGDVVERQGSEVVMEGLKKQITKKEMVVREGTAQCHADYFSNHHPDEGPYRGTECLPFHFRALRVSLGVADRAPLAQPDGLAHRGADDDADRGTVPVTIHSPDRSPVRHALEITQPDTATAGLAVSYGGEFVDDSALLADTGICQQSTVSIESKLGEPRSVGRMKVKQGRGGPPVRIMLSALTSELAKAVKQRMPKHVEYTTEEGSVIEYQIDAHMETEINATGAPEEGYDPSLRDYFRSSYRTGTCCVLLYDPQSEFQVAYVKKELEVGLGDLSFARERTGCVPTIVAAIRWEGEAEVPIEVTPQSLVEGYGEARNGRELFVITCARPDPAGSVVSSPDADACALGLTEHALLLADHRGMVPRARTVKIKASGPGGEVVEEKKPGRSGGKRTCTVQ